MTTRSHRKRVQAKHVPDEAFLAAVRDVQLEQGMYASRRDVGERFPAIPERVLLAKAIRLIDRGWINGCGCGCRGDFELTDAGHEVLRASASLTSA